MGFIGRAVAPSPISANDVPDLPASKITTGTFADARLSSSSVTQHAQSVDLQPVKSDITALALREATNESSASFNLPNQFIDTFATDTLGTKTNVGIASGYVSSILGTAVPTGTELYLKSNSATNNSTSIADYSGNNVSVSFGGGGKHISQGDVPIGATSGVASTSAFWFDGNGEKIDISHTNFENEVTFGTGDFTMACYYRTNNTSTQTAIMNMGGIGSSTDYNGLSWTYNGSDMSFVYRQSATNHVNVASANLSLSSDTFYHLAVTRENGVIKFWKDGVQSGSSHNEAYNINVSGAGDSRAFNIGVASDTTRSFAGRMDAIHIIKGSALYTGTFTKPTVYYGQTVSATGTAIQNTNTVGSAKTKVGGTMLYKDNQGTATLGTDLKVYFTCNGGTNWTEASSYSAITPVYSTGVKQVRLGETTCTSGTDVRYKVEWANQSSGSKETQLHGIGTNY
nr:putative lectin [uncultured Mediterranean phage uvMED]